MRRLRPLFSRQHRRRRYQRFHDNLGSRLAAQAALSVKMLEAFTRDTKANHMRATTRTLGVLLPDPAAEKIDNKPWGVWVPILQKETSLPVRRTVSFDVGLTEESKRFAFEVYDVEDAIRVEKMQLPMAEGWL
ncbi:uncharacterized protein LACBIDRAFT_298890 [Laccaria bicolor S238N-H82]|uniref:Predicted protein n=1 Tax=Laccaria bicolor (strain S238N-H82 / ATCC MYA-4686) TaxID=486041 RepID=B0DE87_LACBS|nr:uncharacterized protein LACBIDRAFT_298890 [Laccaria bicolor S238N-H82]EDR07222.1 predicted protein [Laccaria bicolor S238N-H82]|eukprot:XP_001882153.1 predicted protein [Laccaria bicolor S238N-H82]